MIEIRQPIVGQNVVFVDEVRKTHAALITAIHGIATESYQPYVNLVYVTDDASKQDPYGNQLERSSSVGHKLLGNPPGRFWYYVEEI